MESIRSEAIRIARLAGTRIKELREKEQYQEFLKDGYELVTTADLISNDLIKSEISRIFPNHYLLSEEDSERKDLSIKQPTWIIDPIDGTVGYANDHYQVAVSIAFAVEDNVRVGVVYNPFLDEMFYASEGSGAFLNNKPIKVKDVHHLKQCVIGTGFPPQKRQYTRCYCTIGKYITQRKRHKETRFSSVRHMLGSMRENARFL